MTFIQQYAGKFYASSNPYIYSYREDLQRYAAAMRGNYTTVCLTGWSDVSGYSGSLMLQTVSGGYISLTDTECNWQEVTGSAYRYSQKQAQALVDKIIKNNKVIVSNNLLCARYADRLTVSQRQRLYELQNRLMERNQSLTKGGLVQNVQTSYPAGYAELAPYMERFMASGSSGIGAISVTAIVVISAIVIASLSTAAYFAYKRYADQSELDVKYSKELTAVLAQKLTEEEYNQLLQETKGIVTKARIKQSLSNYGSLLKWGLIAAGGLLLWKYMGKAGE